MKLFSSQVYHIFLRNRDITSMYPTNDCSRTKSQIILDKILYPTIFGDIFCFIFFSKNMETFLLFYAIHLTVKN